MKFLNALTLATGVQAAAISGIRLMGPFDPPPGDNTPIPGDSPFEQCDVDIAQLLRIDQIDISPNPPERGAELTISAKGFLAEDIEEGAYVAVDVRYGYIRLVNQKFDLCEQAGNVDLQCPLEKGDQNITKTVELPDEIPPGKFIVTARAYTVDDVLLTCLAATVEFPYEML
ncbi:phosphatidylglycerol/phosphatidylinositol transfer protein [Trichomonascus vanleenenianus]|uniref:sterol transporter n=1 Tax=Trichomonascus vanleenenianus TaxID=2268995 RepID=UPI003ECBAE81